MKRVSLNIEDIFNLPTAVIYSPDNFKNLTSVSIDSRVVKKKSLFIAIKGKRFDGHDFVFDAVRKGAAAVVINKRKYKNFDALEIPIVTVNKTTEALGSIANIWRRKLSTKIIGITGSSGKTTTKEILATLLAEKYKVNKTKLNNNNHIGVPLTILNTNYTHDVLIAELGTNHFGEIAYSSNILEPDYAMITNIGSSHLEFLKNKKGVLKEKTALYDATAKRNSTMFFNYDDPMLKKISANYSDKISFGFNGNPNVKGKVVEYTNEGRPVISIKTKNSSFKNELPLLGEINAQNYLASVAIAKKLGLSNSRLKKGVAKLNPPKGRLSVSYLKKITLVDDSYNANPESTVAAINAIGKIKINKSRMVILGDMFELGNDEIKLHTNLATVIKKNKIDKLFTIGKSTKHLYKKLSTSKIYCKHFSKRTSLENFIIKNDFSDSVILVKGSRAMRMEEFVKTIKEKHSG